MIILCLWINNRIFAAIFLNDILMNYGYVKVAAAVPRVKVADCKFNAREIEKEIIIAEGKGVKIIAFPELCVTGYTCGDLFAQQLLLEEAEMGLIQIVSNTRQLDIIAILGMPIAMNGVLLNAAVVIQKGKVLGVVPINPHKFQCRTSYPQFRTISQLPLEPPVRKGVRSFRSHPQQM